MGEKKKGAFYFMKSILVIGLGRFGSHLCKNLVEEGNQVMIVDSVEEKLEELTPIVTSAKIGDCTNPKVLKSLGVDNFDIVFVCIGTNFQSSLEITSLVKELGAKYVISKATRDIHAKFLLKNGADEVIYPDRDVAERIATRCSADHVFDYIELTDDFGIYEISPMKEWVGKTIKEVNFRVKYHISILGTKKHHADVPALNPPADHIFKADEHLMIIGEKKHVEDLLKKIRN